MYSTTKVGTIRKPDRFYKVVWFSSHLVFKYSIPAENDHSKSRLAQYSDQSKTEHLNTAHIQKPNIFLSGSQMVIYPSISGPVFKWPTQLECFTQKKNVL
jgi:hypothetical protein